MTDDVLDMELMDILNSEDHPDNITKQVEDKTPTSNTTKKIGLWDTTEFVPLRVTDITKNKIGKSFTVYGAYDNKDNLPDVVIDKFIKLSTGLVRRGFIFRHYGSSTTPLHNKLLEIEGIKYESYLPFPAFNTNIPNPILKYPNELGYRIMSNINSRFTTMKPGLRAIKASRVNALFGKDCDNPVDIVLLYSTNGIETIGKGTDYKGVGDVPDIIKLCKEGNIPFYNIGNEDSVKKAIEHIKTFI